MKRQNRWARGFSLIEVLVVLVIVGILFVVGLVVFGNAGRKDTDGAAGQLIGVMRLARQHAVSARQWTLVVFPNQDGGAYTGVGGDDVNKCLRSVAVLAVVNSMEELLRADQIPSNMQFKFVTDWKRLRKGIYFDDDATLNGNYLFESASTVFKYPMDPAAPNLRVRPMGVVLFRPNGRAYTMVGDNNNGKVWQDKSHSKIYLTADKYYDVSGGSLLPPAPIPGPRTVVEIHNKTGQVGILAP